MKTYQGFIDYIGTKIDRIMEKVDPLMDLEPRGISIDGKYTSELSCFYRPGWTYSFFMGMVAYMYIYTDNEKYLLYLNQAKKTYTNYLYTNKNEIGHDTGFLYSLYAVAMYKLTNDEDYKNLALKAADEVGKRYQFECRHIQAFHDMRLRGITDKTSMLIVDDMMNMCILMWAYKETGHSFYRSVFTNHINTAIQFLIRDDFSLRHAYHFDVQTGRPISEGNICGYCVGSHWARGTAWMIYGLTKALQFTNDEKYKYSLEGVLNKYFLSLHDDIIPEWDFRISDNSSLWHDASAALIVSSACEDLKNMQISNSLLNKCFEYSELVLEEIKKDYLSENGDEYVVKYFNNEGALWGDYFCTELLIKKIFKKKFVDFWI